MGISSGGIGLGGADTYTARTLIQKHSHLHTQQNTSRVTGRGVAWTEVYRVNEPDAVRPIPPLFDMRFEKLNQPI